VSADNSLYSNTQKIAGGEFIGWGSDGDCHAPLPCEGAQIQRYHATRVQSSRLRSAPGMLERQPHSAITRTSSESLATNCPIIGHISKLRDDLAIVMRCHFCCCR